MDSLTMVIAGVVLFEAGQRVIASSEARLMRYASTTELAAVFGLTALGAGLFIIGIIAAVLA